MPVPPRTPPRIPGSQVAPGQKPFVSQGRPVASTHQTKPTHELTDGRLYRVRDKAEGNTPPHVWAENLSYDEAVRLKETIASQRRSKTVRVVDQAEDPWSAALAEDAQAELGPLPTETPDGQQPRHVVAGPPATPRQVSVAAPRPAPRPAPPVAPHTPRPPAEFVKAAVPNDNLLEAARARGLHAAGIAAAHANRRHKAIMATKPPLPLEPPPSPPPSPLTDEILAELEAGEGPGEGEELAEPDLHELLSEVGGGETAHDIAQAKRQRDEDARNRPRGEQQQE